MDIHLSFLPRRKRLPDSLLFLLSGRFFRNFLLVMAAGKSQNEYGEQSQDIFHLFLFFGIEIL